MAGACSARGGVDSVPAAACIQMYPALNVYMTKAYVISEVEILDEELANEYRPLAAASIAEYGGRYLVRGATSEIVEGPPAGHQVVLVEFPSLERARAWYGSASYAKALRIRDRALKRRLTFVEGIVAGAPPESEPS
jgi:uncharacterized protein (DUF1330 family)